MKKILHIIFVFLLIEVTSGFSPLVSHFQEVPTEAEEYALKAVFIYNFTKYIEWQPYSMDNDEFVISVLGPSPVIKPLLEIAATKTVKGKKIIIRQFYSPDDIRFTHILFISQKNTSTLYSVLSKVSKGTLTIGERDGAALEGAAFNFVIINNKLKFEANTDAITLAGLKASSELLKLAILN